MMAAGRGSPARMIQQSEELRSQFRLILEHHPATSKAKIRNLRAAKHRFESLQRPLARSVRLFRPIIEVMVRLANERHDEPAQRARTWLRFIAETPRHAVMLAMLADAADEGMSLTRFCDSEGMDVAALSGRIANFLDRVTNLFGPRQRCLSDMGYTRVMLEQLQTPIVWVIGNQAQSLRPPTEHEIQTCMGHMRAWLRLAQAEIAAEFPDWEASQSFRIFDLARDPAGDRPAAGSSGDRQFQKHIERLALLCSVDANLLRAEFDEHESMALRLKAQKRCSAKAAWVATVSQHENRRRSLREANPLGVLKQVIARWLCFAASTSGALG